jgi:hypothetical protein
MVSLEESYILVKILVLGTKKTQMKIKNPQAFVYKGLGIEE